MEPDLSAMYSPTWTGQDAFEWTRANVRVRELSGGSWFSDAGTGRLIAFHRDVEPHAWLSPAGDWLVFLSGNGLVAFDASVQLRWRFRPFGESVFALYFRPPLLVVSTHWFDEGCIVETVLELESGTHLDEVYGTEPWPTWRAFIDTRLDQILQARSAQEPVPPNPRSA